MKLLSIITPTFGRIKYLKKNLLGIDLLYEKFRNFEWIIVVEKNDLKTQKLFKKNKRKFIKVVIGNYKSAELAFENGVKKSRGKYVKFHGDDDFFDLTNLKFINNQLFKKRNSWIIFNGAYIDINYKITRRLMSLIKYYLLKNYGFLDLSIINYIMTPSIFVKKKVYKKMGGLGHIKRSGSDYVFWMKLNKKYKPLVILNRISLSMVSKKTISGKFEIEKYIFLYKKMLGHNNKNIKRKILITLSIVTMIIYNFIFKFYK